MMTGMRRRWQALGLVTALAVGSGVPTRAASGPREPGAFDLVLAGVLSSEGEFEKALDAYGRVVEAAPDDPYARIELAELLFRLGRLERAAAEARTARDLAPADPDVLRVLGRVEMLRSERDPAATQAALEAFAGLLAREPEDVEALVATGQIHLGVDQPALAVAPLREAARLRPGQPMIEALLARALAGAGRTAEAEGLQRRLLEENPANLSRRLELADLLARGGKHEEAARILGDAPAGQGDALEVRRRLGYQLYLAGDLDAARRVGETMSAESPDYAGAQFLLGVVALAGGHFSEAADRLRPLVEQAPDNEQVGDLYQRALEGLGRTDEAITVLERREAAQATAGRAAEAVRSRLERALLLERSARWEALALLADELRRDADPALAEQGILFASRSLASRGDLEGALALLADASPQRLPLLALRADLLLDAGRVAEGERDLSELAAQPGGAVRVAEIHQRRGDYERSLPILEELRKGSPDSVEVAFLLASARERTGRLSEAVELFRELLRRAPGFAPALNYLGYLWIERSENLDEAVGMVREAVRLDPDNGAYVDSLGWGYFKQGQFAPAVEALERAARLLPSDPTVLEHLGDAHLAAGDPERARDAYRRAVLAGGAEARAAAEKLARLEGAS
jgi:tetratricopeptide (TPR) repeat protein